VACTVSLGGVRAARTVRSVWPIVALMFLCITATALAQRFGFGGREDVVHPLPNTPYDGRFTFVRLNYKTLPGGYFYGGLPAWAHGYPPAEQNLMRHQLPDLRHDALGSQQSRI
jgi:hypothetical protein